MLQKAPRRTRERILELSLRLFNEFGEPNITTTVIAEEMNISPGNLYYHFRNKDDIVNSIFVQFEAEIERILTVPEGRRSNIEDVWLYLHLMFERIWAYRFLYRNLDDLLTRDAKLKSHFNIIIGHKRDAMISLCHALLDVKAMQTTDEEIRALTENVLVVATYWLNFEHLRAKSTNKLAAEPNPEQHLSRGVYQVMALVSPFLMGDAQRHLQELMQNYIE